MSQHSPGWPGGGSPFHAGESAAQDIAGVREGVDRAGRRMIRDFMPDQHRELLGKLPYVVVGSVDDDGRPWASMLLGRPGFVASPDDRTLVVTPTASAGPLHLGAGRPVGLLGIELATRRRNRVNGRVVAGDARGFTFAVDQSFGNCPQYIQARAPGGEAPVPAPAIAEGAALSAAAVALIRRADTFFIASTSPGVLGGAGGPGGTGGADPREGVDVSHRGGKPGFVRVSDDGGVLTAPDFAGNGMFNTVGNLLLVPRAGLLFLDFARGDALAITADAEVQWDGPEVDAFTGAERLLRFRVRGGVLVEGAIPRGWSAPEYARQLAATGGWGSGGR